MKVLGALVSERMERTRTYGKDGWTDKPVCGSAHSSFDSKFGLQEDLLQWLAEEAVERNQSVETVVRTLMLSIFASTHTSANVSNGGQHS